MSNINPTKAGLSTGSGNRSLWSHEKNISGTHAQEALRRSDKVYWRGIWDIDAPEDVAALLIRDSVAQLHLTAKRCSFWGHRAALVTTQPKRRDWTQSCHAISLTFKASVLQYSLHSCPACFSQCFSPCDYPIQAHSAVKTE